MVTLEEVEAARKARKTRGRNRVADDQAVERIRAGYAHRGSSVADLSAQFEISAPTVYKILNGQGCYPYVAREDIE
jgi:hypothetical protein